MVHKLLSEFHFVCPSEVNGRVTRRHGVSCPWDLNQTSATTWYFLNLAMTTYVIVSEWNLEIWYLIFVGVVICIALATYISVHAGMASDPSDRTIYYQRFFHENPA